MTETEVEIMVSRNDNEEPKNATIAKPLSLSGLRKILMDATRWYDSGGATLPDTLVVNLAELERLARKGIAGWHSTLIVPAALKDRAVATVAKVKRPVEPLGASKPNPLGDIDIRIRVDPNITEWHIEFDLETVG